jgi:hypothetical protein
MSTEFSRLTTSAQWSAKLKELLQAADDATRKDDDDARISVAGRLNRFVLESAPNTPEIIALDDLALDAARALSTEMVGGAVDRIAARTAMLRSIAKHLDVVTGEAEQAAASIRLDKVHRVVDALTGALRAVDDLDPVLRAGTDQELRVRLTSLADAMRSIRDSIDRPVRG